ncbi:hypothetical protein CK203_079014 [Vitis vinifera]|uniref:Uncharacterized protein n=1 Tax=Vitis vinifera TaxID=29760 RepID=A0A438BYD6_VITVI|nr:hypothetical protein CK203_079014 [Vitis vinifera]
MDSQIVAAMASIQEAIASLGRMIDGQQAQQVPPQMVPSMILQFHHPFHPLRTSDRAVTWENFDGAPMTSLPTKFRMPEIERYTGIDCPRIHLRFYRRQRQGDVDAISSVGLRPPRHYQTVGQTFGLYYPPSPHVQYRSWASHQSYDYAYIPPALALLYHAVQGIERPLVSYSATGQPCYAAHFVARPSESYHRPRAQ